MSNTRDMFLLDIEKQYECLRDMVYSARLRANTDVKAVSFYNSAMATFIEFHRLFESELTELGYHPINS